jgi:hypothetical protein
MTTPLQLRTFRGAPQHTILPCACALLPSALCAGPYPILICSSSLTRHLHTSDQHGINKQIAIWALSGKVLQ